MKSRIQLIGLAVTALVLPLVVGEIAVRAAKRITDGEWPATSISRSYALAQKTLPLYQRHPFTNLALRPGTAAAVGGRSARINSAGYRGGERSTARSPGDGVLRIVCSGGSTTFDLLASTNETTWPARLEAELKERGVEAEVWNAGFPGWTSLENLISLAMRDLDLAPDIVILYQGINDLQPAGAVPVDPTYVRGHAELTVAALGLHLEPPSLVERSVMVEMLRSVVGRELSDRRAIPTGELASIFPGQKESLPEEARRVFQRNLQSYIALARAHGATPVLISQAMRVRSDRRDWDQRYIESWIPGFSAASALQALDELNLTARRVATEQGAPWIDAAGGTDWHDDDFADPMHYTTAGSAKLASFVADQLVTRLGLGTEVRSHGS